MSQELTKETIEKLLSIKGETRGVALKTDEKFILREKGEEGLKMVEDELVKIGHPIKYSEINSMDFYPISLRILSILVIQKVFYFDEKKIKEMGAAAPKVSMMIKLFMQYFLSLKKTFEQVSKMWRKHYTAGEVEVGELDEKNKKIIIMLKNADFHPIFCIYLNGYFLSILEMIVKASGLCQETKCSFKGDKYHEFYLKWQ